MSLPALVGLGVVLGEGLAVALAGGLSVANVAAFGFLGSRFVRSLAASEGGGLWGAALMLKTTFSWIVFVQLAERLPPTGLVIGLCPLLIGAVASALLHPAEG